MKIYANLVQGSNEWLELRKEYSTASEAPSIFNESKYKSRTELMDEKKGVKQEVSGHLQKLFDKGHATEAEARDLLEFETAETFTPITATAEIDGVKLLASLDGISEDHKILFEHKLWNETLAENVRRGVLEPTYYRQLDQQLLVTGADYVIFVTSDGTEEKREMMEYRTSEGKIEELILGWKQFNKDLEKHEVKARKEAVTAVKNTLPAITFTVSGTEIKTNIADCLEEIKALAEIEINKKLENDQDFANKEQLNKDVKKSRAALKETINQVRGEFVSYSQFEELANELDSILQKMQSNGEKQVKKEKEDKKSAIEMEANESVVAYVRECDSKIRPMSIIHIMQYPEPNFVGAMKGKRTIDSIQNAVDSELAAFKLKIVEMMAIVKPNIEFLRINANDYKFLFNDAQQLVSQNLESFQAVVNSRISEHKKAEEKKIEIARQKIKEEEKAKATRVAFAKIEAAKEKIRIEEKEKAEKEVVRAVTTKKPIKVIENAEPKQEINEPKAAISEQEQPKDKYIYDETQIRLAFLNCLIAMGVDNWSEGYDEAVNMLHFDYPNANIPK